MVEEAKERELNKQKLTDKLNAVIEEKKSVCLINDNLITERNGFTLLDITPDDVRVRLFAWRRENSSLDEIDDLEPYHDVKIEK